MHSYAGTCRVCGCPTAVLRDQRDGYELFECGDCGGLSKRMAAIDSHAIEALQSLVYTPANLRARLASSIHASHARARLRHLLGHTPDIGTDWLEIGPGTGEFMRLARRSGFNVSAIEASPLFAGFLKSQGFKVISQRLEREVCSDCAFDLVAAFHLLEHVGDVQAFLNEVHRVLRPGGVLFVITPNTRAFTDRLYGLSHPVYTEPDHLQLFSATGLLRGVTGSGFELVDMCSKEGAHHVFSSLRGWLGYWVHSNLGRRYHARVADRAMNVMFNGLLSPSTLGKLTLPVNLLYRSWLERNMLAAELWLICRKEAGART